MIRRTPPREERLVVVAVDDQSEILASLRRVFRNEGFELLTTESPRQVLEWIERERVDLLLADEKMPEMRGTDLLEEVQRRSPRTVRVILTAYPGSATVGYGLSKGVEWLISKPWNDDALRLTVRQLLEARSVKDDPSAAPQGSSPEDHAPPLRWSDHLAIFCEETDLPIHCVTPDGIIRWASRGEFELLGYPAGEHIGRSVADVHADPVTARDLLDRLSRLEEIRDHPARLRRKDGTILEVLLDAGAPWEGGRFVHTKRTFETQVRRIREDLEEEIQRRTRDLRQVNADLLREIAERNRAEETLRLNEVRFRLLVEGVKDYAIFMLSPEGIVVSWNVGAERIIGYTAEEILGRPSSRLYTPEDVEDGKPNRMLKMAEREGRLEDEGWRVRKDGSRWWCNAVITAVRDADGSLLGFSKVTRDLTERRKADEERARLGVQMLQGQKLQAIGQLSAGIAHEINNPVGYILSNLNTMGEYCGDLRRLFAKAREAAEAAGKGGDPSGLLAEFRRLEDEVKADLLVEDLRGIVTDCTLGTERIRDIVRSLREFSHVDEGELKPSDLNKVLEDALRICWNELKYNVEVVREYGDLPKVPCFPQRLGQVFINLLVNAAQAIAGKGKVHLTTGVEGGEAVIRVRDTGCGIAPENLRRIFEPFYTTKTVGSGTGLGLHVAYKIVTAHGGKIDVTSKPGEGTEFAVRLPLSGPKEGRA
ncbi:MAG TPA: PAS domain S-box protein [Planctomycetota bacterium]|nr:PAS domain S-box protein [Planctomycetota bacterium]